MVVTRMGGGHHASIVVSVHAMIAAVVVLRPVVVDLIVATTVCWSRICRLALAGRFVNIF
jgi:hypothetical protein